MSTAWILVFLASFCELGFTVTMKLSNGLTRKRYAALSVLFTFLSIYTLSIATTDLPLGVAYAAWTGLGTLFTVAWGIFFFGESHRPLKMMFLAFIVAGVIGMRLFS